ncbi:MAG: response regulator, partial [Deltaproteobacteria bacterium]|nr:response regulator [Deltaproteobacteria bacterium]
MKKDPVQFLTIRYVAVLGLIGLTSLLGYSYVEILVESEIKSAYRLNIAGRQRMLINRLGLLGVKLDRLEEGPERESARADIEQGINEIRENQRVILNGDRDRRIQPLSRKLKQDVYYSGEPSLNDLQEIFMSEIKVLADLHEPGAPVADDGHDHLDSFIDMALGDLLAKLEFAVSALQKESEAHIGQMQARLNMVIIIILLLLLASALLVFRPAIWQIGRVHDELQASEERNRQVLAVALEGYWLLDHEMKTVEINESLSKILGYTEEEMLGRTPDEFVGKTKKEEILGNIRRRETQDKRSYQMEYMHKDGHPVYVQANASTLRDEEGRVTGSYAFISDITAQKKAEGERDKLFRAVEESPMAIVITNISGEIEYVNPAFTRNTGYSFEEAMGKNPRLLQSGSHDKEFYEDLWETILTGHVWRGEIQNKNKIGEIFWESVSIAPIRLGGAEITHFVAVKENITDRKNLETSLRLAKDRAETATKAKAEFLANMSHEIRTPMNGVIGMLELLGATSLNEEQRHYAETAFRSAEMQLSIINDILDFSKIEAGMLVVESIPFNLVQMMEETVTMMAQPAHGKGLELGVFIDPKIPLRVSGDPTRLRQITANLVNNAIKFTSTGEVMVTAKISKETSQHVYVRIDVRDTGIGITQAVQERLFEEFVQADASTTRKYGGTGLGLTISKKLTELMGGAISLVSEPGKGSTFTITIPFEKIEQYEGNVERRMDNLRVLIVDDNATNREILMRYCESWGMSPQAAPGSLEGLELLKRELAGVEAGKPAFDLALLDYHMPDMDGLQLGREIMQHYPQAISHMVMLSSSRPEDKIALQESGIELRLVKPIRQSQFFDTLVALFASDEDGYDLETDGDGTAAEIHQFTGRVLVVEDTFINQQVIRGALARHGIHPEIANNGREALALTSRNDYDLVLMDVQMPEMDGLEATRRIREREQERNLPHLNIIAMTAHVMKGDREICLEAGMDDYLPKPIRQAQLEKILAYWLQPSNIAGALKPEAGPGHEKSEDRAAEPSAQEPPAPPPGTRVGAI